jgi:16S rRNA (cytidine1402-2'-O)-methyltransferase
VEGAALMALAVCATPIGNLEDVTLRVLRELREAELVLCEDTRRTRALLAFHEIPARLTSLHARNELARTAEVMPRLVAGARVALVSDAGLPAINDPGRRLVAAALAAGVDVTVLPGPSAVETALVASGFAADGYVFVGFLPRSEGGRQRLWSEIAAGGRAAVAFESPRRLPDVLASLARGPLATAEIAVCRELTKRFEEVVRGSAESLLTRFAEPPKGEITLVVAPGVRPSPERSTSAVAALDVAADAVRELVAAGVPRRRAAQLAAALSGHARNDLYRLSL